MDDYDYRPYELIREMRPGIWLLEREIRTTHSVALMRRLLFTLVQPGRVRYAYVGAKHNPIYGQIAARGVTMPRRIGFHVWMVL